MHNKIITALEDSAGARTRTARPGRKNVIASAALLALLGFSLEAQALALGAMTVRSALGEPLRAEIEVPQISSDEASTFQAAVASPQAFRAAGVDYVSALAGTRVTLHRRPNGEAYLRVAGSRPINEPFLGVVIEANWATGRMVRDYTLLVDPPGRSLPPPVAVTQAQTAPVPAPVPARPAPPPVYAAPPVYDAAPAPARPLPPAVVRAPAPDDSGVVTRPAPLRPPVEVAIPAPRGRAAAPIPAPGGDGSQVTVRRGDTAAAIAAAHTPAGVSLDQMLVAMLRANPEAFIGGNVNRMKAGAVLDLPTTEQASATPAPAARREVVAQTRDFLNFRRQLAQAAPAAGVAAAGRTAAGGVQPQVRDSQAAPSPDQLRVSKGAATSTAASGSEAAAARTRQEQDQRDRVAELNKNLAELARLQSAASAPAASTPAASPAAVVTAPRVNATPGAAAAPGTAAAIAAPPAVAPAAAPVPAPAPVSSPSAPVVVAATPTQAPAAPAAAAPTASPATVPATGAPATTPGAAATPAPDTAASAPASAAAADTAASDAAAAAAAATAAAVTASAAGAMPSAAASDAAVAAASAPVAPVVAAPAPPPAAAAQEPSFLDSLSDNPLLLPAAGLGLLALLALLVLRARQRKKQTAPLDSSFIESRVQPDSFFGASGGQRVNMREGGATVGSSSMAYSPSQLDAAGDVDPVAEADVYLAYGRDLQAEEILKEALHTQPGRTSVHRKLAEIYAKRRDARALEALAITAHAVTQGDGADWLAIAALGSEIDPNNRLYQPGGVPGPASAAPVRAPMAPDTEPFLEPALDSAPPRDAGDSVPLDLDLSLEPATSAEAAAVTPPTRPAALTPPSPALAPAAGMAAAAAGAALTRDTYAAAPNRPEPPAPAAPAAHDSAHAPLDFDLDFAPPSELNASHAQEPEPPRAPAPAQDRGMIDFDMAALSINPDSRSGPELSTEQPEDADEDPAAIKLSLAQEFHAIGDTEGARALVKEVIAQSSGSVRARAERFLAELS